MHRIRLRGPWELRWAGQRLTLEFPCDCQTLLECTNRQPFELVRRFGQPTGIETGDTVWLVVETGAIEFAARLNGAALGVVCGLAEARFDVTDILQLRNELSLSSQPQEPAGAHPSRNLLEVRLEIAHADPQPSR